MGRVKRDKDGNYIVLAEDFEDIHKLMMSDDKETMMVGAEVFKQRFAEDAQYKVQKFHPSQLEEGDYFGGVDANTNQYVKLQTVSNNIAMKRLVFKRADGKNIWTASYEELLKNKEFFIY